jgi:hypothetical protein
MRRISIIIAVIGAAAVIIAALINIFPSIRSDRDQHRTGTAIGGIVVDQDTNQGIPQARISLAGRTENYITEDSGNFRIDVRGKGHEQLRLHVVKRGYIPLDTGVENPAENLVLQMRKQ